MFSEGNWVDLVLLFILVYFLIDSFRKGFILTAIEFLGFLLSIAGAFLWYAPFGVFLMQNFALSRGFAQTIGFLILGVAIEVIFSVFANIVLTRIPRQALGSLFNQIAGILLGLLKGVLLTVFFLTIAVGLPISGGVKKDIVSSKIGGILLSHSLGVERGINKVFGEAIEDTFAFLTIQPQSDELVQLGFSTTDVSVDEGAEQEMMTLVNKERTLRGLRALTVDPLIRAVARDHSKDMLARGYFAHFSPEGKSPADRMRKGKVAFLFAGENLAFAPSTQLAHTGLMKSPGHRANILSSEYSRIGIGVIDGGVYGKMFTQNFAD